MKKVNIPIKTQYGAALYMRLSKDDDSVCESASISTQRKMLRAYAKENNFTVYDEYVDDGISGTTFERPDFKRMIRDIENKKVNMVITKDLSRLGRDYILSGQYIETYFPSKKVRYIAINDGYDSESQYTDIAPFKNIINEMYARDTSKKIRSAFATLMKEGAFIGACAPYGYKRDPKDKHHLVIDELSAEVVREIFRCASNGISPAEIARTLNNRDLLTPSEYRHAKSLYIDIKNFPKHMNWTSSTITKMLKNVVYLGHTAQGKTTKVSFKSKISIKNPKENWFVSKNTHEPIISKEIFDIASRKSHQRTCAKKGTFKNIFSGIAKCADCGRNMSTVAAKKKGAKANLSCGRYKLYGSGKCSNHFIDYDDLYEIVFSSIKEVTKLSKQDETEILKAVKKRTQRKVVEEDMQKIIALKKRSRELDNLFERLYEDNLCGLLNSDRMKKLLIKYETESKEISKRIEALQKGISNYKQKDITLKLEELLHCYTNPEELTPELLYRLIDHIEVGQGVYKKTESAKEKQQSVRIFFRFAKAQTIKEYKK
jgi:DNA invertase Pin-like site-specific DNA recombinase